jgi:hypothetical protein
MSSEFQSRLLYKQKSSAVINEEEPVTVSSTIYAIRYLYPGASQHTTSRIRITCTYRESERFEAHAGVIERWSDKGWLLMDDYTDDVLAFHSEDEFRKRMLDYTQSFIMGVPLSVVDKEYVPESTMLSKPRKDTPKRLFNFDKKETIKNEKIKPQIKDNYDTGSSKNDDDDDDDLDWL